MKSFQTIITAFYSSLCAVGITQRVHLDLRCYVKIQTMSPKANPVFLPII